MAAYYYKGAFILAPFTITSNEPVFDMTTMSLKTFRTSQGAQRWELSFNVQPEPNLAADFLVNAVNNFRSTDTMIMPQLREVIPLLDLNTSPTVFNSTTAGNNTIPLDIGSMTGTLPKGYFIKFSNHDKMYVVLNSIDFDNLTTEEQNNGYVDLNIYPSLRSNVTNSTTVLTGNNVEFSFYQSIDNATGITFTDGILSNPGTITLIEAL